MGTIFSISMLLGGLALFIFGMQAMTEGLTDFAGSRLRVILGKATRHRAQGLGMGTFLGVLMHSGATVMMVVGFANAGLVGLTESLPVIFGANVGTTLSMQMISFHLTDLAFGAIAVGLVVRLAMSGSSWRHLGMAVLGFGLLFLGMKTMGDAITPHRDTLRDILSRFDADTLQGTLLALAASVVLTTICQSSGATIGMVFVLVQTGALTSLNQVYPLILGAHIGTCTTALFGSIGTNLVARRCALAHLVFNLFNVTLALLAAPLFKRAIELTTGDLVHQAANTHTGVILFSALLLLPFTRQFSAVVEWLLGRGKELPEGSHLDPEKLLRPETAIAAAILELRRVASLLEKSLELNKEVFFYGTRGHVRQIRLNEEIVNRIKTEMIDYLEQMTDRYLSRRQTLLVAHLGQCIRHLERIGDHLDAMCDLSIRRKSAHKSAFDTDTLDKLFSLVRDIRRILALLTDSFDADKGVTRRNANSLLEARSIFETHYAEVTDFYTERVASHQFRPVVGVYFGEYMGLFRRLVQHAQVIATHERSADFWIKQSKLDQLAKEIDPGMTIISEDAGRFLSRRDEAAGPADDDPPPPMTDT